MIPRLLNWQAIAGIAASLALVALLILAKIDARHWKKQSASFEQLYKQQQQAFATTTANYRAAAETARAKDQANSARVAAEQRAINERTSDDYETRLAAARAAAARIDSGRLRPDTRAAADPRPGGSASVPGVPAATGGAARAAAQDRLPRSDALTATEQAIQLDELIRWVRAQSRVRTSGEPPPTP